MCGLVAIADFGGGVAPTRRGVEIALERMRSRGPDQQGQWTSHDRRVRMGHCRLAIVDLSSAGQQPMQNEDGTITLVCNGEIYNYPSLRDRLEGLGHEFRSNSDSEVILHAYEQWGEACLEKLTGMFAFVIWDENKRRLLAARDHVGIKPLYYAELPEGIAFSSNLDALLELLDIRPDPDPLAFAYALLMRYVPAPHAFWKRTSKLEPGHYMVWSPGAGSDIHRYWEPPVEVDHAQNSSDEKWAEIFHQVLRDHLLADVPIGIFLSGGLDSSAIAAGLHHIGYPAAAISASLPEYPGNEYPVALKTARCLGIDCQKVTVTSSKAATYQAELLQAFDEPEADSGPLPMYLVCLRASRQFKVVLAGDGGDECFGGYKWHRDANPRRKVSLRTAARELYQILMACVTPGSVVNRDRFLLTYAAKLSNPFSTRDVAIMLSPTGLGFNDEMRIEPFHKHYRGSLPPLRALQRVDLMTFCSDSILPKVDRASMARSLEVRVPFLDRRIVQWGLQNPVTDEEGHVQFSKPLVRRYVKHAGLDHLLEQKKSGFSMKGTELKMVTEDTVRQLNESWLVRSGFLDDWWQRITKPGRLFTPHRLFALKYLADWIALRKDTVPDVCRSGQRPAA